MNLIKRLFRLYMKGYKANRFENVSLFSVVLGKLKARDGEQEHTR